ncbi:MAG: 50S ribosomal protein L29 [Candidatus Caldarchaeum sp.]
MKAKELRELSDRELLEKIAELKSELRKVVTEIGTGGAVQNPMRKKELRKSIARAYTILTERRLKKK